jgi:dihydroorotate dehydrogenase electron transfer subunit
MPTRFKARLISVRERGCAGELILEAPPQFGGEPGQFVHVCCGTEAGRILRRPFSLYDAGESFFSLLVKKTGEGSRWLAERKAGDSIDCMGPLGRAFSLPVRPGSIVLVAGGAGIAPLRFLAKRMRERHMEAQVLWGMERGGDYADLPDSLAREMRLQISSRDGSRGFKGDVLELYRTLSPTSTDAVYACGPKGMLADLAEILVGEGVLSFQLSIEERMACGLGVCKGCVVPGSAQNGGYLTVCRDGPVFDGGELDWKRINESTPR